MEKNKPIDVINKATGIKLSILAHDEKMALITVFILYEEDGKQQHLPSWYRAKILVINLSKTEDMLVLDNWTVKMRKEND